MSANVRAEYVVYCGPCHDGAGPFDYEEDAESWASEHDAEFHTEPDRDDAARDQYLDTLKDQR